MDYRGELLYKGHESSSSVAGSVGSPEDGPLDVIAFVPYKTVEIFAVFV